MHDEAEKFLNIASLTNGSSTDGPGMRAVLWLQGCPHHCPGCHNEQTWPTQSDNSRRVSVSEVQEWIRLQRFCGGLSISGGEPLFQCDSLKVLLEKSRQILEQRNWTVWLWTGYTMEEIRKDSRMSACVLAMPEGSMLITGRFDRKKPAAKHRGSNNQKMYQLIDSKYIDVSKYY